VIDWAVSARGMQRVVWHVNPANVRSKAIAARLGMTYEGTMRSSYALAGDRQDTELWSLLAGEWRGPSGVGKPVGKP
jgi:ribosomal-protein-serine acetyltransferase